MVVHAALAVLLSRLSGTDDVAVGTPVAGRGEAALDDLVGMFVNTLVLRTAVDPAGVVRRRCSTAVREADLAAFGHADIPFERLVDALAPERSTAHTPLFQVLIEFQNSERTHLELPGLTVESLDVDLGVAKFDLQLSLAERSTTRRRARRASTAGFSFATDVFDARHRARRSRTVRCGCSRRSPPTRTAPVGDIEILRRRRAATRCSPRGTRRAPAPARDTLADLFDAGRRSDPAARRPSPCAATVHR